jgi:hypothetical protein
LLFTFLLKFALFDKQFSLELKPKPLNFILWRDQRNEQMKAKKIEKAATF